MKQGKVTTEERDAMRARYLETRSMITVIREFDRARPTVWRAVRDLTGIGKPGRPLGAKTRRLSTAQLEAVSLALLYEESTGSVPWSALAGRLGVQVDELKRLVMHERRRA